MTNDPLLQPFQLGPLRLKNRVLSTSHEPAYSEGGMPTERYIAYHVDKARGGIALTMIGGSALVAPDSPPAFGNLDVTSDAIIPHFRRLADAVHEHGCAVMTQLTHLGRRTGHYTGDWLPVLSPSCVREPAHRAFPKVAEEHDIDQRHQLPEEVHPQGIDQRGQAVDEGHRDGHGDERHHPRRPVAHLRHRHPEEGKAAVQKNHDREDRRDPAAPREGGDGEAQGRLHVRAVQEDGHRQGRGHEEAAPEHRLVALVHAASRVLAGVVFVSRSVLPGVLHHRIPPDSPVSLNGGVTTIHSGS